MGINSPEYAIQLSPRWFNREYGKNRAIKNDFWAIKKMVKEAYFRNLEKKKTVFGWK